MIRIGMLKLTEAKVSVIKSPTTAVNLFDSNELDVVNKLSGEFIPGYVDNPAFLQFLNSSHTF